MYDINSNGSDVLICSLTKGQAIRIALNGSTGTVTRHKLKIFKIA